MTYKEKIEYLLNHFGMDDLTKKIEVSSATIMRWVDDKKPSTPRPESQVKIDRLRKECQGTRPKERSIEIDLKEMVDEFTTPEEKLEFEYDEGVGSSGDNDNLLGRCTAYPDRINDCLDVHLAMESLDISNNEIQYYTVHPDRIVIVKKAGQEFSWKRG